jgi:hypothetical protein
MSSKLVIRVNHGNPPCLMTTYPADNKKNQGTKDSKEMGSKSANRITGTTAAKATPPAYDTPNGETMR